MKNTTIKLILFLSMTTGNFVIHGMDTGTTPLIEAASEGNVPEVQRLLNLRTRSMIICWRKKPTADVDARGHDGKTAIIHAAAKACPETVSLLLANGSDVHDRCNNKRTPLIHLARVSDVLQKEPLETAGLLLRNGADIEAQGLDGATSLITAIARERFSLIELLLNADASLETADKKGLTPLAHAVKIGHMDLVQKLLTRGANPNTQDSEGKTLLDLTAGDNLFFIPSRMEVGIFLLRGGIVPTPQNIDYLLRHAYLIPDYDRNVKDFLIEQHPAVLGETLLFEATEGRLDQVKQLITDYDVDIETRNDKGSTPLLWASANGHLNIAEWLLENGADVNAANKFPNTALLLATQLGQGHVIPLLLEYDADVNARDSYGRTPLLNAVGWEDLKIIKLLLQHGAIVGARDSFGNTPLMHAATLGKLQTTILLVEHGADLEILNNEGKTVFDLIESSRDTKIRELYKFLIITDDRLEREKNYTRKIRELGKEFWPEAEVEKRISEVREMGNPRDERTGPAFIEGLQKIKTELEKLYEEKHPSDCAICLDSLKEIKKEGITTLACNHKLCTGCYNDLLTAATTNPALKKCPECRAELAI